ncbi:hypothetical protein PP713_06215 [Mycobacterium sp. CSUR Q5927]|nr:hypothetical protein [Mycobacterium sp. CSUR Q5927]
MTAPCASSTEQMVVYASALVDLIARTPDRFPAVRARLAGIGMHAPAHFDAQVQSALWRIHRADVLTVAQVESALDELERAPMTRHEDATG